MSGGIIDGLLEVTDDILSVRDEVGAVIDPVFLVLRTWYTDMLRTVPAARVGDGYAKDTETQMLPSPGLKNYSQDVRLREGGAVKAGDIILTNVSRQSQSEATLDGSTGTPNTERFYRVGGKLYQVINITKKYVTFDVQLRELTNQRRY